MQTSLARVLCNVAVRLNRGGQCKVDYFLLCNMQYGKLCRFLHAAAAHHGYAKIC